MGFHASGDAYTKRFDDITVGQPRTARCVDDSLLWDTGIEQAFWHTFDYIKLCADNGIVFNREKFVFAQLRAEFAGFEITEDSYRPPEHILASISNFPVPKSVTDVKSFFGLVNQVAYAFSQADTMAPFRELLKKEKDKRPFYWDDTLQTVFDEAKREIVRQVCEGVRSFELNRPTCLATDWSKTGLGYTLTQRHCDCQDPPVPNCGPGHWKLVLAGSRFTKDPETRYAPIEGEALALVQGLQSCRMFTLGCPDLIVAVDHKPLIKIFNDRELDTISNPRLLQLKEKTLMYKFRIVYIPGVTNDAADAMSRYPSSKSMESEVLVDDEVSVAFATTQIRPEDLVTWQDVNTAAASDQECIDLANAIREGFPKLKADLPVSIRQFWPMRDNLYMIENVPFRDAKMLVPKPLRKRILEGLHAAHQGVNGMLANARQRLFWPGLDAAIRLTRAQCRLCNEHAPSQHAEPLLLTPEPEVPFEQTVVDFYEIGKHYFLIYADRYSGWVEVAKMRSTSFQHARPVFLKWFATFGVPEEQSADGGPPFNGFDYSTFLHAWGIRKRQSSAHYPQSNGRAEAAVKSIKRTLLGNINQINGELDTDKTARALLTHRNTPNLTGVSPAVALF